MFSVMAKIEQIQSELKAIEEWNVKYRPLDVLDEIGIECRRLRVEELVRTLAELASQN